MATREALVDGGVAMAFCDFKRTGDVCQLAAMSGLRLNTGVGWTWRRMGTGGLFRNAWSPVLVLSRGSPNAVDRSAVPNWIECEPVHPSRRGHDYEKPSEVFRHVFGRVLRPGSLVLDPFAGSGASAVPALELGASWLGCDLVTGVFFREVWKFRDRRQYGGVNASRKENGK
jgi:site-specific DNA-methyltransferase (adenine-specific)